MFEDDEAANDNAGVPLTELDRARSHLLVCQASLAHIRQKARCAADKVTVHFAEGDFLAALSWVWDAQERASTDIRIGIYQGGLPQPAFPLGRDRMAHQHRPAH